MAESRFRVDGDQDGAGTRAVFSGEFLAGTAAGARASLFTRAAAGGAIAASPASGGR